MFNYNISEGLYLKLYILYFQCSVDASHKCVFTGGQQTVGKRPQKECWAHPHPCQMPGVAEMKRKPRLGVIRQVTDRGQKRYGEEMHAGGCGVQWEKVCCWRVRRPEVTLNLFFYPPIVFIPWTERSWQTELWSSTLKRKETIHQGKCINIQL